MTKQSMTMSALGVLIASLALATGCSKRDETAVAAEQAARSAQEAGAAAKQAANDAATATKEAAVDAKNAAKDAAADATAAAKSAAADAKVATANAADQASNKVSDAVITTSVNAALAGDPQLSALSINVDTDAGRVALKGTAPDATAKDRATALASAVKGVVSVDNQLAIKG